MKYVIVSPVRNEGDNLQRTIDCVAGQTIRPVEWILVNDGSTDATPEILKKAAAAHPWIRSLSLADRGHRRPGGGVVEAFYQGYDRLTTRDWDYVVKLDGDLEFQPDYFSRAFACFDRDPKLAVAGGTICVSVDGQLVQESKDPQFHVRGATKIYRRAFWDQLGRLIAAPGWDTLDELKANMLGWTTYTIQELPVLHLRPTGAADGSWKNSFKNGRANYVTGYHPLFMVAKCLRRVKHPPVFVQAAALFCGFFSGYFKGGPRVSDTALVRYLRQQQMRCLMGRESLWR